MDPLPQRGVWSPSKVREVLRKGVDSKAEQILSGHQEEDTKEGHLRGCCGRVLLELEMQVQGGVSERRASVSMIESVRGSAGV